MDKYTIGDLRQRQSLPLEAKVRMSISRIEAFYDHFDGDVYVSVSGGKDSDVLAHLVKSVYPNVQLVFADTGLEYPEVRKHALEKDGVIRVKPEMSFRNVLSTYGYPVISKDVSQTLYYAKKGGKWAIDRLNGLRPNGEISQFRERMYAKWKPLIDAPFLISEKCCKVMKEAPLINFERERGLKPYLGILANESTRREQAWFRTGCNAFDGKRPHSSPMSFWTEQDVLEYIVTNHIEIASVYGDIVKGKDGKWVTTGLERTGCMFCMYGVQSEKHPNRFERMKETHPKLYEYCMKPTEENGLGLDEVLNYLNVPH